MTTHDESVFIGKYESTFIFKAEGRLTQKSLWNANTAVQKCMDDPSVSSALVDITQCTYMDSTILGILARWAIMFTKTHASLPFLVGLAGNPLESIFQRMNLNMLFRLAEQVDGFDKQMLLRLTFSETQAKQDYAAHILSAHETLAELSDENAREFATVINCLKLELGLSSGERGQ